MDPPYSDSSIGKLISQLAESPLVGTNSTVVVTHSPHLPFNSAYSSLSMIKDRRHGDSYISVFQKEAKD
jgi:16S rRNA G966 N2-methylase RsmD